MGTIQDDYRTRPTSLRRLDGGECRDDEVRRGACRDPPWLLRCQGHCRGRFYLRPSHRDELFCHVRIGCRSKLRAVQGPVQSPQERTQRLYVQRYGHHHAQQRYALFNLVAGSACRADGSVGPGRRSETLLLDHAVRRRHLQLRIYWQPSHRQRSRRLHDCGARLEGRESAWNQESIPVNHSIFTCGLSHPAFHPRTISRK